MREVVRDQRAGRLDSLDDRLIKLSGMLSGVMDTLDMNASRVLGSMPPTPPTPATLGGPGNMLRPEAVQDTAIGRLFDRVSALTALAEALNTQAHRFDSL